jgi:hypothetical protein
MIDLDGYVRVYGAQHDVGDLVVTKSKLPNEDVVVCAMPIHNVADQRSHVVVR